MKQFSLWVAAASVAVLLSACGGGGGSDAPLPTAPTETVPDSATASVQAYTAFTADLARKGEAANTWQPLLLNMADAPTSESAAPAAVE